MTNVALPTETSSVIGRFVGKFIVLKDAIRELWLSFAIKCLSIAAYGLTNSTLVLWLHADLHYPDSETIHIVFVWSMLMSATTLVVGSLTDTLGFRKTLLLGTILCIAGRAVMVWSTTHWVALYLGLGPVAIGEALGGPVLVAAARSFSNTKQRSMSFSMIYAMMNLGFLIGAWLFDFFRKHLGEQGHLAFANTSTYQTLFLVSIVLEVLQFPLILWMRERAEATDEGLRFAPPKEKSANQSQLTSAFTTVGHAAKETANLFSTLMSQAGFYRLLVFLCLIAFVKVIYRQMDYIYPTFGVRELGPGAPIGILWGLNSLLILFMAPIAGALTQRFSAYSMVIVGGLVSSASIFIMALPPEMFAPAAHGFLGDWIGHWWLGVQGDVHPYYLMIILFVFVLSLGEAFYSPRVYEYAAAIAPKGQEASYSALSYIPILMAKLILLAFSGQWLMKYCPETGPRHPQTMWLLVALMSLVAPVGLVLLRPLIQVRETGREDDKPAA